MCILVTELTEQGSLVNFVILFLHRTLRVHEVRTLSTTKQIDHRCILRRPVQLHEIVLIDPYGIVISRGEARMELVATSPFLRRVRQHDLLDRVLEGSQHRTEMQSPENDLNIVHGLVAYDLGCSKQRVELGTFLVTLVHIRVEVVNQGLHSDELCDSVRPGLPALVHVDMRYEEAGDSDAVFDGGEVLAKLWVYELMLEVRALANRKRHPAIEKADPMPEKRERLGSEVEVTERGVIASPGLLDRGRQRQRHVDEVGPETIVGVFWCLCQPKSTQ